VSLIWTILYLVLLVYTLLLWARLVIEIIQSFARDYRPKGFVLLLFEFVFTATDPPGKFLRRVIPPLRLGAVSLDLSLLLLLLVSSLLQSLLLRLAV
jgi:YggT family protein